MALAPWKITARPGPMSEPAWIPRTRTGTGDPVRTAGSARGLLKTQRYSRCGSSIAGRITAGRPGRPGPWRPCDALGAEMPGSAVRWPMFGSLDYIYMPAADVDGET